MPDFLRHLPVLIYECATFPDGRQQFNYVSERSQEVLGLHAEVLLGNSDAIRPLFSDGDEAFHNAFSGGVVPPGEDRKVRGRIQVNGSPKWIELCFTDEVTDEGVILRRGIIRDAEQEGHRRDIEAGRYASLLERLPIGVVIHCEGKIVFANTNAHSIIGADKSGALLGLNAFDFVHPEYLSGIMARIREVDDGRSVPMVEERFIRIDGTEIDVETMAFPFTYKGKDAVQVIFRDITEKKRNEARIRLNETLFTQLFQNIPMAVVMLDEQGKVSEVNLGFEKMFGYGKDELKGKNLNDYIVPDDLRSEGIDINNLIASNRVISVESIRKHRSGAIINVILYGVPIVQDRHVIGIYGGYVDITDRKKVEEELKVRNAELDHFVYKVSHDLRAPLSSVLGLVNLSKVQGNSDNPLVYMQLIGEKVQALDNFIGDVLSHSKNLKMDVNIGRVDLERIIEQTFTELDYLDGARQMKRVVKVEGIDFYSDQWRISEIFRNLISNAIKYRRANCDEPEVIAKIHADHLCADITFADNGIGIKEASLKRIFDMFYRATDQSDGSGIGLYIVKNAVEKLGGQIKVASTPGQGTRFHILLPNRINSMSELSGNQAQQI